MDTLPGGIACVRYEYRSSEVSSVREFGADYWLSENRSAGTMRIVVPVDGDDYPQEMGGLLCGEGK